MYGNDPQLLLVEKDLNYANLLKGYFQALHFNVVMLLNSEDAYHSYVSQHFDIAIIEPNLPDNNGFTLIRPSRLSSSLSLILRRVSYVAYGVVRTITSKNHLTRKN